MCAPLEETDMLIITTNMREGGFETTFICDPTRANEAL